MNKATIRILFSMRKKKKKNTASAIKAMMNRVIRVPRASKRDLQAPPVRQTV
jgi:hypothetical protein